MKKIAVALLFVAGLTSIGQFVYASCLADSGICWSNGVTTLESPKISNLYTSMPAMTVAQVNTSTPTVAGELIYVSDGAQSRVCLSSGTGRGAYVVAVATGVFTAASYPHCN